MKLIVALKLAAVDNKDYDLACLCRKIERDNQDEDVAKLYNILYTALFKPETIKENHEKTKSNSP